MKWFKRIAQGFSPGKMQWRDRPERAAEFGSNITVRFRGVEKQVFVCSVSQNAAGNGVGQNRPITNLGRPCRAIRYGVSPRAKARGYSLKPFHGQKREAASGLTVW